MLANSFSYLSYDEIKDLLKDNKNNPFLLLESAYKNPSIDRGLASLHKLIKDKDFEYKVEAKKYYFFRLLDTKQISDILNYGSSLLKETDDSTIRLILSSIKKKYFELNPKEIIKDNFYLYLYFAHSPNTSKVDFAYFNPNDKYSEAFLIYSLYRKLYGLERIRFIFRNLSPINDGARVIINLNEREMLSLIQRNPFIKKDDLISYSNIKGSYPSLRKLKPYDREEVLASLIAKEGAVFHDSSIELSPGGFFLLSLFIL